MRSIASSPEDRDRVATEITVATTVDREETEIITDPDRSSTVSSVRVL